MYFSTVAFSQKIFQTAFFLFFSYSSTIFYTPSWWFQKCRGNHVRVAFFIQNVGRNYFFEDIMVDSYLRAYIIYAIMTLGRVICMMGFLTKDAKYVKKQMLLGSWQWVMTQSCDKICRTYFMEMIFRKKTKSRHW